MKKIQKVAVIGAGVMGSAIAGYLAGAGISCHLLDRVPEGAEDRDSIAKGALRALLKTRPPYLFSPLDLEKIIPGNTEDHLQRLKEVDWIIEAVVEQVDVKRSLFEKVEKHRKKSAIISSNTSGISLEKMIEGFSPEFQSHFLITHFFNPVRHTKLLEIVPGEKTHPQVLNRMVHFGQSTLGKSIVYAKDTPNFIANRIGVYAKMLTIHEAIKEGLTVEEVDQIFGPLLGRPKSAIFRTADLVGLDTTAHVVGNLYKVLVDDPEREVFQLPDFYKKLLEKGQLGQKSGAGFYRVEKTAEGKKILALDFKTLKYRKQIQPSSEAMDRAREIENLQERTKTFLMDEDDRYAQFARTITLKTMVYALSLIPEISDDVLNIDNSLKWGYNWEMGLFETWDALGVEETLKKMEGWPLPENLQTLLQSKEQRFYKEEGGKIHFFDFQSGAYKPKPAKEYVLSFRGLHEKSKVVYQNSSASILDLSDGILGLEIHTSPVNMVDDDVVSAMDRAVEVAERNFAGLLIANQASQFCAGTDFRLVIKNIHAHNWEDLDRMIQAFQQANQRLKYSSIPVVAVPFGLTLGGGCEICLGANHIHATMEVRMGLGEAGLIPTGGGCLNMLKAYLSHSPGEVAFDSAPLVSHLFEILRKSTLAIGAKEAQRLKFLAPSDTMTFNGDRQIWEAKQLVIALKDAGYQAPLAWRDFSLPGEDGLSTLKLGLQTLVDSGLITEYARVVGAKLAGVLCGGKVSPRKKLREEYILELEKEAFLSLCGEKKTLAQLQQAVKTHKPLTFFL